MEQQLAAAKPSQWDIYFPEEEYQPDNHLATLIQQLVTHLATDAGKQHIAALLPPDAGAYVLPFSYQALKDASAVDDLRVALVHQPAVALKCLTVAFAEVIFGCHNKWLASKLQVDLTPGPLHLQPNDCVADFRCTVKDVCKSHSIGRLVSVTGTVVRMTPTRSVITAIDYVCFKCGTSQRAVFEQGRVCEPKTCTSGRCKQTRFAPDYASAESVDWQRIRLQEIQGDRGAMPQGVDVELRGGLTDRCAVGDVVTVVGIVNTQLQGSRKQVASGVSVNYVDALTITNPHRPPRHIGRQQPASIDIRDVAWVLQHQQDPEGPRPTPTLSKKHLEFVATFATTFAGQQLRLLVQSLCPCIYGQELVKMGLLLALLGGVPKRGANGCIPLRGDIHVLLVGDPGMGKSQMLKAACDASPRGVYVCGNGTTSAGLTVSTRRDPDTGVTMFEAGAVVLADGGVCCVDEFDKISSEHQALLGVMEQQEVTIAKAGLVASLPARTAVLAAANPAGGHYHRGKTVGENLKMTTALLSRFDLMFIMVDKPDEAFDARLSEHVMALHSGVAARVHASGRRLLEGVAPAPQLAHPNAGQTARPSLQARLQARGAHDGNPLPTQLLRVYIEYARAYCRPVLSDAAKAVLQDFYVQLRSSAVGTEGIPITTRQLESMIRLVEARARAELREEVTQEDAEVRHGSGGHLDASRRQPQDVVELMRTSLYDLYLDDRGVVDFRRGGGRSQQAEAKRFLGALAHQAQELHNDGLFSLEDLYALADKMELQVHSTDEFLSSLNDAGELLKKGPRLYQLRCAVGGTQRSSQPLFSQRMTQR